MLRRKPLIALLLVLSLAFGAVAAWHYRLPGIALYWYAMQTQEERWQTEGVWLPHYRVAVEGRPIEGIEQNASGLTWSAPTGTLFAVINKHPRAIIELDTDGRLLRTMEITGARDPEGITHVRDNIFAIADERDQAIYRVEINPDTERVDTTDAPRLALTLGGRSNRGYEGISWDSAGQRLFVSQEKYPQRVLIVSGLPDVLSGAGFDLQIDEWQPAYAGSSRLMDLSSLSLHESTGNLLLLSDESALIVEYDPDGNPVSMLPMWRGFHGLTRRVPQAEGVAIGPDGALYVISEPNLFYRFERSVPAPWAK